MNDQPHPDVQQLRTDVARLTRRVEQLELSVLELQRGGADLHAAEPEWDWGTRKPAAEPPSTPAAEPPAPTPAPVTWPATPAAPAPQAAQAAARPQREPVDWGKIADQLFAARTLAWAGGVATALGVVLLFVLAAGRGWVTPPMRVGLGVAVSLVMLCASIELDRRRWRADAILAAAGVGVAGLYASLWAAMHLYGFFSGAVASPLAALIAAIAVAVAIRIRREPLAVFGIAGAMLTPVLVSLDLTAAGVLFASVMLAASIILRQRLSWHRLAVVTWLIGLGEAGGLVLLSIGHTGFGLRVVAVAVVTALFVALALMVELWRDDRESLSVFGGVVAASAFTLSMGTAFVATGMRHVDGHSEAGLLLIGLTAVWMLLAAVPVAVRRTHPDLTDLLAAFALTAAATATGLLAGGPALVCGWSVESAALVLAAERMARRSGARRVRLTAAAGAYLGLAAVRAFALVVPTAAHLPALGTGSWQGSVALAVVAAAGIAYCYGARFVESEACVGLWTLPAVAIGYLPAWALPAEYAVVAYAALAAALLAYRRTPLMLAWLRDEAAIAIAAGWWAAGAAVALVVTAPADDLARRDWAGFGAHHGLAGVAALAAAATVAVWSVRRPERPRVEYVLLVPVATAAYLAAEALAAPHAFWAWLAAAGGLAAVVHVPAARRALRPRPLVAASAALLGLGLVSAWSRDSSLVALFDHGTSRGWESIALATAAGLLLATAVLETRRRTLALWLPYALCVQLGAMLLPGQYPLVVAAGLAAAASVAALAWPGPLARRLDRARLASIGAVGSLAVSALVLLGYETPDMLFRTSHTPASGLAAAIAATVSLWLAAIAGRSPAGLGSRTIAGVRAVTALVYLAAAAALWTLAAAILGAAQLPADPAAYASVHDHFQQGHVAVSITWVLVGLGLVVASLRGDRRGVRAGGIGLLFVALGKLFLYDLAYLTEMARAVSFIGTGSVLLVAALLLQRFAPQVKAALGDDGPDATKPA